MLPQCTVAMAAHICCHSALLPLQDTACITHVAIVHCCHCRTRHALRMFIVHCCHCRTWPALRMLPECTVAIAEHGLHYACLPRLCYHGHDDAFYEVREQTGTCLSQTMARSADRHPPACFTQWWGQQADTGLCQAMVGQQTYTGLS